MNRFRTSNSEGKKKGRRFKRHLKLLLKDSDNLEPLKRYYHWLFKKEISQIQIIDELLSYNKELRNANKFVNFCATPLPNGTLEDFKKH